MEPKRECPSLTSSDGEPPTTSSGDDTNTVSSGEHESESGSNDEPAKPLQRKKSSSDSDSDSDSGDESNPKDGICAVKSLDSTKEGTQLKKPRFQRLWSDKDEIKLLQAMIKFRKKMNLSPSTNSRAFNDFLNDKPVKFEFPAGKSQIRNKIRKMKAKFTNRCKTGRVWKKPHNQKVAQLSYVLWGGGVKKTKAPDSADENVVDLLESPEKFEDDEWASISSQLQLASTGLEQKVLRIGVGMIGPSEMEKLKEKWRRLRLSELQIAHDRAKLVNEQAKLIMDGYRRAMEQV
ncbi:probable transcription factor At1g61730 [Rhodamnia argentea]|uniref:Probable transcription factor At1g61730 n=1 Tax=Rhodamnia argentea TaxID=178133 RepID=A0A8B8R4F8_9MYRT|nr:probable transcription factor At1g61730 [Rhodamnia argentea]